MNKLYLRAVMRDTMNGCVSVTRTTLTLLGLAVLCLVALVVLRPEVPGAVQAFFAPAMPGHAGTTFMSGLPNGALGHDFSFFQASGHDDAAAGEDATKSSLAAHRVLSAGELAAMGSAREQAGITRYLARKYHVSMDATDLMVSAAYLTGRDQGVDPKLILAVVAIESGFNPFAESVGGAQGLMQVMAKVHEEKLDGIGGVRAALNPVSNIQVGAVILKDCIRRGGTVRDGLRLYVGAGMADDGGYGARVLQEKDRIEFAARGGNPVVTVAAPALRTVATPATAAVQDTLKHAQGEPVLRGKDAVASL